MSAAGRRALRVRTAAKVNLLLQVGRRQADGYHPVETVLQTIDLGDELSVCRRRSGLALEVKGPVAVSDGADNLVWRAADLILAEAARLGQAEAGLALRLVKRVPTGAGLGGGSGDAAAALRLGAKALGLDLSRRRLLSLARGLGADVPFFLAGGLARGSGRGDRLRPLDPIPQLPVAVLVPPFTLATGKVYQRLDFFSLTTPPARFRMRPVLKGLRSRVRTVGLSNDLEKPVFLDHPELKEAKRFLEGGDALLAGLSGSGSAVFGIFEDEQQREHAVRKWRRGGWRIYRCQTLPGKAYGARFR